MRPIDYRPKRFENWKVGELFNDLNLLNKNVALMKMCEIKRKKGFITDFDGMKVIERLLARQ